MHSRENKIITWRMDKIIQRCAEYGDKKLLAWEVYHDFVKSCEEQGRVIESILAAYD
jgi:hypothetical protein